MRDRSSETDLVLPDLPAARATADSPFAPDRAQDGGAIYFLGVFLLLLAFFILMNAISQPDDVKSRGVISSVAATFRSDVEPGVSSELFVSRLGGIPEPAVLLEGLEALWLTAVPAARVEVLQPGRLMEISLPLRELFLARTADLRSDRSDLLRHSVDALSMTGPELILQLSAFSGPEGRPRAGEEGLGFDRAIGLAAALQALEPPQDAVAVGLDPEAAGRVRFRFAFRDRARAAVTLTAPGAGGVR